MSTITKAECLAAPRASLMLAVACAAACFASSTTLHRVHAQPAVTPRMVFDQNDYFGMPWPGDQRRKSDGTLDLDFHPAVVVAGSGMGQAILRTFQPTLRGFGTNSGVFFAFTGALDSSQFPDAKATLAPDSPVMLVNLDAANPERIPVLLDFKPTGIPTRSPNLLTVLPVPGFSLEPGTRYAAILFKNLFGAGQPLAAAPLLDRLARNDSSGLLFAPEKFALLRAHKDAVDAYVRAHTSRQPSDVVAFTVYTTQTIGTELTGVTRAIANLSDEDILSRIDTLSVTQRCGGCSESGLCPAAILDGTIRMPLFQARTTLTLLPFASTGGGIAVNPSTGVATPRWPDVRDKAGTVPLQIRIPCQRSVPEGGWPFVFRAEGTGGNAAGAAEFIEETYKTWGRSLDQVVVAITPYMAAPRQDGALKTAVTNLVKWSRSTALPPLTETQLADAVAGGMYYAPYNPLAARNNQIQSAADALYIKRLVGLLPSVKSIAPADANLPANGFKIDGAHGTLYGHSQGAGSAPLALTVSPAAGGFRNAYLTGPGGGGLVYNEDVIRDDARGALAFVYGADAGFDRFNPVVQLLQTAIEGGSPINYARSVATDNLLIVAGYSDGCATRETAVGLATALARYGKLELANTSPLSKAPLDGIQTVLDQTPRDLPMQGNLANGHTGAFVLLPGYHSPCVPAGDGCIADDDRGASFLHYVSYDSTPPVQSAPDKLEGVCEKRVD